MALPVNTIAAAEREQPERPPHAGVQDLLPRGQGRTAPARARLSGMNATLPTRSRTAGLPQWLCSQTK